VHTVTRHATFCCIPIDTSAFNDHQQRHALPSPLPLLLLLLLPPPPPPPPQRNAFISVLSCQEYSIALIIQCRRPTCPATLRLLSASAFALTLVTAPSSILFFFLPPVLLYSPLPPPYPASF
jgi:hypothetical protein